MKTNMKATGTEVGFEFSLYRVSLSVPERRRSGRGIIIANDVYSVPCPPGYAIRVTESPDYAVGEVVYVSTASVRALLAATKPCRAYANGEPCRDGRDHCFECGRHLDGDGRCAKRCGEVAP